MTLSRLRGPAMAAFIAVAVVRAAPGQTGGTYDLRWNTQAGGGLSMAGAGYTLTGTVGSSTAATMQGGGSDVRGGFWAGVHATGDLIFGSGFESLP